MHYAHCVGRVGRNGKNGIASNLNKHIFEKGTHKQRFGKEFELSLCDDDNNECNNDCYNDDSSILIIFEPRDGKLTGMKKSTLSN